MKRLGRIGRGEEDALRGEVAPRAHEGASARDERLHERERPARQGAAPADHGQRGQRQQQRQQLRQHRRGRGRRRLTEGGDEASEGGQGRLGRRKALARLLFGRQLRLPRGGLLVARGRRLAARFAALGRRRRLRLLELGAHGGLPVVIAARRLLAASTSASASASASAAVVLVATARLGRRVGREAAGRRVQHSDLPGGQLAEIRRGGFQGGSEVGHQQRHGLVSGDGEQRAERGVGSLAGQLGRRTRALLAH